MKSTLEYLDAAVAKGKFKNDYQFSIAMKWSKGQMPAYRNRSRVISARHCLQIAAYLQLTLQESVRLLVMAETERSGQLPLDTRDFFSRVMQLIGFTVTVALIAGGESQTSHGHVSMAWALLAIPTDDPISTLKSLKAKAADLYTNYATIQLTVGNYKLLMLIALPSFAQRPAVIRPEFS